jgi:hypothetical protein
LNPLYQAYKAITTTASLLPPSLVRKVAFQPCRTAQISQLPLGNMKATNAFVPFNGDLANVNFTIFILGAGGTLIRREVMKVMLWRNMIAMAVEFKDAELDDLSLSDQLCNTRNGENQCNPEGQQHLNMKTDLVDLTECKNMDSNSS